MSVSLPRQSVAIALAALYAMLTMWGSSLHELVHATDPTAAVSCRCAHGHDEGERHASSDGGDRSTPSFGRPVGSSHDADGCGVCQLLAKLKVGERPTEPESADTTAIGARITVAAPVYAAPAISNLGARGPPAIG